MKSTPGPMGGKEHTYTLFVPAEGATWNQAVAQIAEQVGEVTWNPRTRAALKKIIDGLAELRAMKLERELSQIGA